MERAIGALGLCLRDECEADDAARIPQAFPEESTSHGQEARKPSSGSGEMRTSAVSKQALRED